MLFTVTVKLSVLMVTVTEVFSAAYSNCHSAVFSALYGHLHSAPYRHSAVLMNVPNFHTISHQNDAAASHSCHFNTVLYPRSYSECQLSSNHSHRDITGAVFSVKNFRSHSIIFTGTSADLSTYI